MDNCYDGLVLLVTIVALYWIVLDAASSDD